MTGTAVERTERAITTPLTGEVVLLDSTSDVLAAWLHHVREAEAALRDAKRIVGGELLDRMDREAKWTARLGRFEIKGDGPGAVEYDAEALRHELEQFVMDGSISGAAMDEAVELVTSYKAKARGINALKKLGGRVAEAIERCTNPSTKDRRVSVKELHT